MIDAVVQFIGYKSRKQGIRALRPSGLKGGLFGAFIFEATLPLGELVC